MSFNLFNHIVTFTEKNNYVDSLSETENKSHANCQADGKVTLMLDYITQHLACTSINTNYDYKETLWPIIK